MQNLFAMFIFNVSIYALHSSTPVATKKGYKQMTAQQKIFRIARATCMLWLIPMTLYAQADEQGRDGSDTGQSKIVFESLVHDFGTVQPKSALKHSFTFKNQGTDALLIEKVKAG